MNAIKFYISLSILVLIFSCSPEELPPIETENPVFSVSGNLVDIIAGENDFYLFTDYKKDNYDVYSFIGRFAQTSDCAADCNEEMLIEIRDAQQTQGSGGVAINNALMIGNYTYQVMNPVVTNDEVVVNLTAEPEGGSANTYQWIVTYIQDSLVTQLYTTPEVNLTFTNTTNISLLDVCLNIFNSNNCQIQYCNEISLDTNAPVCQADFSIVNNTPVLLELEAEMQNGIPPFSYEWSTGDLSKTISQILNGPFNGIYCVTITDSNGCSDEICKAIEINQGASPIICSSRFSYEKTVEPGSSDSLQLSTVFIQYTDTDGIVYRSDLQSQPNTSNFEIISVEDYEANENGDKTKKLKVSANIILFDTNGVSINFPFEGVFAIAYP